MHNKSFIDDSSQQETSLNFNKKWKKKIRKHHRSQKVRAAGKLFFHGSKLVFPPISKNLPLVLAFTRHLQFLGP